ncbi:MAG TPA: GtrA family protein [Magnetospirillaceae bacterium]|nr:GtrA family protein [Magnetospirillaceae bacterium]
MATKTQSPKNIFLSLAEKGRFVVVGIINTATDFVLLNLLVSFAGLPLYGANFISAFIAMCVSFVLNKNFVFHENSRADAREFFTFIGVTLLSIWGVQTLVIFLLTQQFPQPLVTIADAVHSTGLAQSFSIEFIVNNTTKIIATVASLIWNYLFYKYVVFTPKNLKKAAHEN